MSVGVECKVEGGDDKDETSSSPMNTSLPSPLIESVPTTRQEETHEPPPPLGSPAATAIAAKIASTAVNHNVPTSVEPPSKRIKLENEATTDCTTTSSTMDTKPSIAGGGVVASTDTVTKAAGSVAATISISLTEANSAPRTMPNDSTSASTNHDTASASVSTTTVAATTQPQHTLNGSTATVQQRPQEAAESTSAPTCSNASAEAKDAVFENDEGNSSSNSHPGPSSVVTASVESSSHSDNTSSNSSNDSLHESTTTPVTTATEDPATTSLPTTTAETVPPPTAGAAAACPTPSAPPTTQVSSSVTPKVLPTATSTKTVTTRTIPPPTNSVPPKTLVPPPVATSNAPVSNAPNNNAVPLKSLNFGHLHIKYIGELEYMLREFRKLERQLLGAKGAQQLEESVGSRERREKLHSFILHLEDTIRQIELGCKLEEEGKSAAAGATASSTTVTSSSNDGDAPTGGAAAEEAKNKMAEESALSNLTKEKEEEETVQKLEEHILANLLPVKVRLKKQLAAQQGATQNPPGMPARRGGLQPASAIRGKGTFVEAVEKKRKHAESLRLAAQAQQERQVRSVTDPTQFGKPLGGVGSSLTKKLHGATLGSKQRRLGHGVGSSVPTTDGQQERKILHAGMVPKSLQQESGLSAASGVHEIVTTSPPNKSNDKPAPPPPTPAAAPAAKPTRVQSPQGGAKSPVIVAKAKRTIVPKVESKGPTPTTSDVNTENAPVVSTSNPPLSEEDKLKFKKHRRLRKLKRLKRRRERELARQQQQQSKTQHQVPTSAQPASNVAVARKKAGHSKAGQKKKGPRVVEYICSQCSEAYSSTCEFNPWWALAQHKCPKCQKTQIPRIDISSPANAIEYHPALLSHLEDGGRGNGGSIAANSAQAVVPAMPIVSQIPDGANDVNSESDSDLSELSDDNISIGSLKAAELESDLQSMTPAERAEHETFGNEYDGPILSEEHAAKLLILMGHAATCPCHHKSEKHRDVCRSTKYMMLHVRDCPGTTSTFDVCPFPWCRKVKHLLYHLVSCENPDQCAICSPREIPKGLRGLVGLNAHRMKKHRERMIVAAKATLAARNAKSNPATKKQTTLRKTASATQVNNIRKVISGSKLAVAQSNAAAQQSAVPPVKVKAEPVATNAPFVSSTAKPVGMGGTIITEQHPTTESTATQSVIQSASQPNGLSPSLSVTEFDINAEIAKLDELGSEDATDVTQALQAPIIVTKQEVVDTSIPVPLANNETAESTAAQTDYANMPSSDGAGASEHHVLPTPMSAIKLEDHDADHAELTALLATNSSAEESTNHSALPNGDVGDVSEYLETEYQISTHQQQDSVMVTEHQQQIDMSSGVDTMDDPNSDPLANIHHDMLMDSSDLPHPALVHATPDRACITTVKEEYSEPPVAPATAPATTAAAAT